METWGSSSNWHFFFPHAHVKFNMTISYFNFWREYIERRPSLLGETMYKKNTNIVGCMKKKSFYLHKKWFTKWRLGEALLLIISFSILQHRNFNIVLPLIHQGDLKHIWRGEWIFNLLKIKKLGNDTLNGFYLTSTRFRSSNFFTTYNEKQLTCVCHFIHPKK